MTFPPIHTPHLLHRYVRRRKSQPHSKALHDGDQPTVGKVALPTSGSSSSPTGSGGVTSSGAGETSATNTSSGLREGMDPTTSGSETMTGSDPSDSTMLKGPYLGLSPGGWVEGFNGALEVCLFVFFHFVLQFIDILSSPPLPLPDTLVPKGSILKTTKDGMKWTLGALIGQGAYGKVWIPAPLSPTLQSPSRHC